MSTSPQEKPEDSATSATVTTAPESVSAVVRVAPSPDAPALPARYRDLGRLAVGGFGELRRVHDAELDRVVAMKLLRADLGRADSVERRFLAEARLTAGLEHPGIVSVHDRGRLEDGRLWFTMREVRGRTLGEVSAEVHALGDESAESASGWSFRRLIDAFARVCQAVAYAHRRGVVHRDLKPDNIMVGELGEALVMDWGLGLRLGAQGLLDDALEPSGEQPEAPAQLTRHGDVLGTPAYMPPEQARGQRELHGLASDVYALGAVLYHLLAGRAPYAGSSAAGVLRQVLAGPPLSLREVARGKALPAELVATCERAMQREREARHPDAEALAREVLAWLDGARRREQALAVVARASALPVELESLRARAEGLRHEARVVLGALKPFDPVERKRPGWALEDEAAALDVRIALLETEWLEAVHGALTVEPSLTEAHEALATHYRARLVESERAARRADTARFEALLRTHDRGANTGFLRGEGALTLVTDPPGASVLLERYELRDRRLVAQPAGALGTTPLHAITLPQGSYRLRLRAPGRSEVLYPVLIERGAHWDGRAPGESEPTPVPLPREGELGEDEVYVPAGWCWTGGDPEALDGLPARRLWIEGFVMGRFPVTNREWLAYLEALRAAGREEEMLAAVPRKRLGEAGDDGQPVFVRDASGAFVLPEDWHPEMPVVLINWHEASAYARWCEEQTGRPWRLPNELEREKAARGVDARLLPWGKHEDATYSCTTESHRGAASAASVRAFHVDEGPSGARGLAGNVRDWCLNAWKLEGPLVKRERSTLDPTPADDPALRSLRGGAWVSPMRNGRAAARFAARPEMRWTGVGVRLVRSM